MSSPTQPASTGSDATASLRPASSTRTSRARPGVAAAGVALVMAGAGTAAANDWLPIFQPERIAAVSIDPVGLVALADLRAYGDVVVTDDVEVHEVPDAAAAAAATGLDVPVVAALPPGVSGQPVHHVLDETRATFTFSTERAAHSSEAAGAALPPTPPDADGSQLRLSAGPGVVITWTPPGRMPALVVGRAVAPRASSSGAEFATVRNHLLSLPGLPDDVASQLRALPADGSTLPLPVPTALVTTSSTEIDGRPATVLATRDRSMAAVVWVDDGVVTAVAGTLDTDEVLAIARDLG